MKIFSVFFYLVLGSMIGCNAGTSADLLTYDSIVASAEQIQLGVNDLASATAMADAKTREQFSTDIAKAILRATKATSMPAEDQARIMTAVQQEVSLKIADLLEQERRRAKLLNSINDNIAFVKELCRQGKEFVLYRSDINTQWKSYLQAQTRTQIEKGAK